MFFLFLILSLFLILYLYYEKIDKRVQGKQRKQKQKIIITIIIKENKDKKWNFASQYYLAAPTLCHTKWKINNNGLIFFF